MRSLAQTHCLVTGANSGVGRAVAAALAKQGVQLCILCRNEEMASRTAVEIGQESGNSNIDYVYADFSLPGQIHKAAQQYQALAKPLHVLVNNAGIMRSKREMTAEGQEMTFAVNYLGPFILTNLLMKTLLAEAPARVVNVSSIMYRMCKDGIRFDDITWQKKYAGMQSYAHSKLANILFSRELNRRYGAAGLTSNAVHPGAVRSNIGKNDNKFMGFMWALMSPFLRSAAKGAETPVFAALDKQLDGVGGEFLMDCKKQPLKPWAQNDEAAKRLWELSARITKVATLEV